MLIAAGHGLPPPASAAATALDGLRLLTGVITMHTTVAGEQHGQVMATVGIRN